MGSTGGGTTKTTTNQSPWGPQQGYLQDVFSKANQLFTNSYNQGLYNTPQSPLYQTYINEALNQSTGALPQEAQMNATWNQALQAPSVIAPNIQAMVGAGYAPDFGNRLVDMLTAGYGQNAAIPALASAANSQWAQPFVNAASSIAGTPNPYIGGTADYASLGMANPALAGLAQTASGQYLTPDTNPYLYDTVQNALEQAKSTIASQFNQGGRYGSGMMAGTQARELGNIATGAYANAYEQERARQEAAKQALGGQFLQGAGLASQGQQQAGALTQGQMGQGLSAILGAGGLAGNQQQLGQQALSTLGSLSGEDINRQLQAQQAATQGYLQDIQNRMTSQQAGTNAMLQALGLSSNALNFAPTLQAMGGEQLSQLANAAQVQQQLLQMPEQAAWDRLANYLAMIQGGYGGTATQKTPGAGGSNILGNVMGGLTAGAGLASMFSSRQLKREQAPVDVEQVADGVLGLPVTTWSYNGADDVHIGPYAEDFRDTFGVGDGITIKYVDMFGVLFATVQHLLVKNAELTARMEELENGI